MLAINHLDDGRGKRRNVVMGVFNQGILREFCGIDLMTCVELKSPNSSNI